MTILQITYTNLENGRKVACVQHQGCPIPGGPPTLVTCWETLVLPNIWRNDSMKSRDPGKAAKARKKCVEVYLAEWLHGDPKAGDQRTTVSRVPQ